MYQLEGSSGFFSKIPPFWFVQSDRDATFSLKSLCDGVTRSQAAKTFFCLLVLSKQQRLHLQQDGPYKDILVKPGPAL